MNATNSGGESAQVLREKVYAWLGCYRDDIDPEAVQVLQDILGPLETRIAQDTIMELQADVTALTYHLERALQVIKGDVPLAVNQIQEAERTLANAKSST